MLGCLPAGLLGEDVAPDGPSTRSPSSAARGLRRAPFATRATIALTDLGEVRRHGASIACPSPMRSTSSRTRGHVSSRLDRRAAPPAAGGAESRYGAGTRRSSGPVHRGSRRIRNDERRHGGRRFRVPSGVGNCVLEDRRGSLARSRPARSSISTAPCRRTAPSALRGEVEHRFEQRMTRGEHSARRVPVTVHKRLLERDALIAGSTGTRAATFDRARGRRRERA